MNSIKVKNLVIGEGIPNIALSLSGSTRDEIIDKAKKIDLEKVDLVEWRADYFKDALDLEKVLEVLKLLRDFLKETPLIFTLRSLKDGGQVEIPIDYYIDLNKAVAKSGLADILDIEVLNIEERSEELISYIQSQGGFVIGSSHDFLRTPSQEEMIQTLKSIEQRGADILKLAVMANTEEDVSLLLNTRKGMKKHSDLPLISISMGRLGTISRVPGKIFASCITFGCLGEPTAPGQISIDKLYRIIKNI